MLETKEPNDIPAILARANAATEGPWITVPDGLATDAEHGHDLNGPNGEWLTVGDDGGGAFSNPLDAEFCAHSRTDVPRMVAEILSLRAELAALRLCPKMPHDDLGGYLHDADDDRPYDVDGVLYCGRCHYRCDDSGKCSRRAELSRREKENG